MADARAMGWAQFPDRKPNHFVFPSEKVGIRGNDEIPQVFDTDPTKTISSWKVSWTSARIAAGVNCRFHDLRDPTCTRMLERGGKLMVPRASSPALHQFLGSREDRHLGTSRDTVANRTLWAPLSSIHDLTADPAKLDHGLYNSQASSYRCPPATTKRFA